MVCHGVPEYVLVGGRVCVDEGNLKVVQGHGKFIPTPVHSEFVYNNEKVHFFELIIYQYSMTSFLIIDSMFYF